MKLTGNKSNKRNFFQIQRNNVTQEVIMENKSDMKISGSGSISSGVYNDIKISGSGGILGDVDCNDIKISGSASCKGEIKVNNLKISGSSSFYKDVEVKEFLKIM